MTWTLDQVTWLGIVEAVSGGDIVTLRVSTPAGEVSVMGEVREIGTTLLITGAHMHSEAEANAIGPANLRVLAAFVLERLDCDEAIVEGAPRTTGARPGHRPRYRFSRRRGAAAGRVTGADAND